MVISHTSLNLLIKTSLKYTSLEVIKIGLENAELKLQRYLKSQKKTKRPWRILVYDVAHSKNFLFLLRHVRLIGNLPQFQLLEII